MSSRVNLNAPKSNGAPVKRVSGGRSRSGEGGRPIVTEIQANSERWLIMAGAMDKALDAMRVQWTQLTKVRDWLEQWRDVDGNMVHYVSLELDKAIEETEKAAAILLHGRKGR
jgi:hypothetical protein